MILLWYICVCVCARALCLVECVSFLCAWYYLFLYVHNSRLDTFSISILKSKYFMAFCSSRFAGLTWIRYVRSFSKWMWVYSFVYHVKDHPCQVWWFNVLLNSIMLFVMFQKWFSINICDMALWWFSYFYVLKFSLWYSYVC